MDWDLAVFIWRYGVVVSAAVSVLATGAVLMALAESRRPADKRDAARSALQALGALVLSPVWFIVVPLLVLFGVNKLFKIAEVPTPRELWAERQAEKIERLERRIEELEDETRIGEDAA